MREVDRLAIVRVKQQLAPLFEPNPWLFWSDMLLSGALGWTAFVLALRVEAPGLTALCLVVATLAHYRCLAFTHELEHLASGVLTGFRAGWHLIIGMPMCLPHFVYRGLHRIHHSTHYYGTAEDPEYVPFVASGSYRQPLGFLALPLVFPLMVASRYLVLAPLSLLSRRLRSWVMTNTSSFVMKLDYARELPTGRELVVWRIEECTTSLFVWSIVGLVWLGELPSDVILYWYLMYVAIMFMNAVRVLVATHRYASDGDALRFEDHIFDSVNLQDGSVLNYLVGPVGLRFHATHHLFPGLPYYALPYAHRLLMQASRGEGRPLQWYVAAQWSNVIVSAGKLIRLTRQARRSGRRHSRPSTFPDF